MHDALRRNDLIAAALRNRLLHAGERMLAEQLQHAYEVTRSGEPAVACFQMLAEPGEVCRKFPVAVDIGVIQAGRLISEHCQVMQRIKDLFPTVIRPLMLGDWLSRGHDHDPIDVRFDRHRGEGITPRHAITVLLPDDRLILVDLARFADCRIEVALG